MRYKHLFLAHVYKGAGGGVAGLITPTPNPIDTEFRRLCESGIFGINVIKICSI